MSKKNDLSPAHERLVAHLAAVTILQTKIAANDAELGKLSTEVGDLMATGDRKDRDVRAAIKDRDTELKMIPAETERYRAELETAVEALAVECESAKESIFDRADVELMAFADKWEPVLKPLYPQNARSVRPFISADPCGAVSQRGNRPRHD